MKELEKLSDEALDHRLHYVRGLCPEGIAVIVPRYTTDLNECAKVEAGLTDEQWKTYAPRLEDLVLTDLPNIMPDWQRRLNPSRVIDAALILARPHIRTIALIATLEAK